MRLSEILSPADATADDLPLDKSSPGLMPDKQTSLDLEQIVDEAEGDLSPTKYQQQKTELESAKKTTPARATTPNFVSQSADFSKMSSRPRDLSS